MAAKKLVGAIVHFYPKINVAVLSLKGDLKKGDDILIEGNKTYIEQKADSMQIDKKPVEAAKKGNSVGLRVLDKVRAGDKVYII